MAKQLSAFEKIIEEIRQVENEDAKNNLINRVDNLKEFLIFCGLPIDRVEASDDRREVSLVISRVWEIDLEKVIETIKKRANSF